jgi:hypothetical protein
MTMSTFKDNKKMLYIALYKHISSQNPEKLSKIQSKLLDTAERSRASIKSNVMTMQSIEETHYCDGKNN